MPLHQRVQIEVLVAQVCGKAHVEVRIRVADFAQDRVARGRIQHFDGLFVGSTVVVLQHHKTILVDHKVVQRHARIRRSRIRSQHGGDVVQATGEVLAVDDAEDFVRGNVVVARAVGRYVQLRNLLARTVKGDIERPAEVFPLRQNRAELHFEGIALKGPGIPPLATISGSSR